MTLDRDEFDGERPEPAEPARWRTVAFGALGAALLVGGLAICGYGVSQIAYSAQQKGTPGEIQVTSCVERPATGPAPVVTDCSGVFRSDDHRVVDEDASLEGDHHVGDVLRVRRTPSGGYAFVGNRAKGGWILLAAVGVVAGAFGIGIIRDELRRRLTLSRPDAVPAGS